MAERDELATEQLATEAAAGGGLIGRTLGKFTLVERLGSGGSGEVFRAEQAQLGRSAVIKVLRREVAAAANRIDRFLREAKLASRLDHPYAAHVYAFGAEADGVLWIAMEHVRGVTLDDMGAERGAMPAAVFAPLFVRLCEVVHTAHELGIVHRDIKGSNVMVIERAGQLLPKLLDFGIAKGLDAAPAAPVAGSDDAADDSLTSAGTTLGSPHYMAPEQWTAPAGVDARADIYALGVLAYRCVAGRLPFEGIARLALPEAHRAWPPPPLPASVAAPIAEAIARALAKAPEARWPSALAFGEAVRAGVGAGAEALAEAVPLLDPAIREAWLAAGPQPIADAIARLARAATTVEADAALRELVAIACRWLAVLALAQPTGESADAGPLRDAAQAVIGRDDAAPWLRLARAAAGTASLPGLAAMLDGARALEQLAERLDDRDRPRTAAALAADLAALPEALGPLAPLLAYRLVVGRGAHAEAWHGPRRPDRERVVVWGDPLADGRVALLDAVGRVVAQLSPLVQVVAPMPSAEPELFLLWRSGRGRARLVAAPWGFERDDDQAALRLASLTTEDADTIAEGAGDRSPYPGLAAYGADDAARFVGREREVEALANRLVRAPMLAVLGPSGAGKSSFIHAGLLPRLAEQHTVLTMRPGRHPMHALAALAPGSEAGLVARLRAIGERAPRGLVIAIDQLEELETLCGDPDERERFAAALAGAADSPAAPVRVVVTLRDDFASIVEAERAFHGRFEVFVLATPPPEALRRIVTEPARRAQVTVEPRVVDEMVAEVAGRPASLPLLSFTAAQLWDARDRAARTITYTAYAALGGVAGALSAYADQIYGSLGRAEQDTVRDLFARLVAGDGTRIPAPRAELEQLPGARAVLAHLIDARLVVVREDAGADIAEIVHECLAERWPRLARWRSEDAADRALLGDVRAAARRWQEAGRRADLLWRGEALAELRRLAARSTALTDAERAFTAASERAEQRSRRTRRAVAIIAMTALAAAALVMAYLGLAANRNRAEAEHSAEAARTSAALAEDRLTASLVAQGRRELNDGRALAALAYFGEALRRGAEGTGLRFMIAVATRAWKHERLVVRGKGLTGVTTTPDAIIAGDLQGVVRWWTAAGAPLGELATDLGEIGGVRQRGDRMIVVGRSGALLVDPATRRITARFAMAQPVHSGIPGPGADEATLILRDAITVLGPDGKPRRSLAIDLAQSDTDPVFGDSHHVFLAIGSTIQVVDTEAMTVRVLEPRTYAGPMGSADGSTIAWLDRDRVAHVAGGDGAPVTSFRPAARTEFLTLSATGDRIGALAEGSIAVHDRRGRALRTVMLGPDELQVRLRGDELWTGSATGVVRRYEGELLVASLPSHTAEIADVRLADELVVSVATDGTLVGVRGDARHVVFDPDVCKTGSYTLAGPAVGFTCEDGQTIVYVGRRLLGAIADRSLGAAAIDPRTQRSAIAGAAIAVFDPQGNRLASATGHAGPLVFEDGDRLLVADEVDRRGLWRFTISSGAWQRVAELAEPPSALAVAAGGVLVGTDGHHVLLLREGVEVHRTDVGDRVDFLSASADGMSVAVQLARGGTLVLDGRTAEIVRRFEPADSIGIAAMLDARGELVIRTHRGTLTVWDRATGEALISGLDLLKLGAGAMFDAAGRIELVGRRVGVLDIARETRSTAELIHALECRVPLRVAGGRLELSTKECP